MSDGRKADMWLSEMWRTVPEVSRHERDEKRKADRADQRRLEEWAVELGHQAAS